MHHTQSFWMMQLRVQLDTIHICSVRVFVDMYPACSLYMLTVRSNCRTVRLDKADMLFRLHWFETLQLDNQCILIDLSAAELNRLNKADN